MRKRRLIDQNLIFDRYQPVFIDDRKGRHEFAVLRMEVFEQMVEALQKQSSHKPNESELKEIDALFKATQALPQAELMTEDEILTEIQNYRHEQKNHN